MSVDAADTVGIVTGDPDDTHGVTVGYVPGPGARGFRLTEALAGYAVPVPVRTLDPDSRVSWAWTERDNRRIAEVEDVLAKGLCIRRSTDPWGFGDPDRTITPRQASAALRDLLPHVPDATLRRALRALRGAAKREREFRDAQVRAAAEGGCVDLVDAVAHTLSGCEPGMSAVPTVGLWAQRRVELIRFLVHLDDMVAWSFPGDAPDEDTTPHVAPVASPVPA